MQFYGVNEGTPVFFGDKDEGKFGSYWVSNGKVRHQFCCVPWCMYAETAQHSRPSLAGSRSARYALSALTRRARCVYAGTAWQ